MRIVYYTDWVGRSEIFAIECRDAMLEGDEIPSSSDWIIPGTMSPEDD